VIFSNMQHDLNLLEVWFDNNKLVLNATKSKYMVFKNRNVQEGYQLTYRSQTLERVDVYKYLGLIITSDFKWDKHIDSTKTKILPYIFALSKLKTILPRKSLTMIYYAYIHSHIIYLNPIWSGSAHYKLNELYVLQKRALKYVMNVHWRFPTEKLFEENFKSLPYILKEELLIIIYKIVNNLIKHNYEPVQLNDLHSYQTRRRSHYNVQYFKSKMSDHNVFYKGMTEFNKLPSAVRNVNDLFRFKKQLLELLEKNVTF
jgi:hypothetical protein